MALIVAGISVVQGYVLARSAVAVSCAADTAENYLATITVPANALGIAGALRITTSWSFTNNANNKTQRVRFSGTSGTGYAGPTWTTQVNGLIVTNIFNRGSASSQVGHSSLMNTAAAGTSSVGTSAVDTTVASTIVISGQKASAGDTLTLESYLVELFPTS